MALKKIDLEKIYEEIGKKRRVSPKLVKQIVEHFFKTIRHYIDLPLFPRIFITGLFKIDVDTKALIKKRLSLISGYRLGNLGNEYPLHGVNEINQVLDEVLQKRKYPLKFRKHDHRGKK